MEHNTRKILPERSQRDYWEFITKYPSKYMTCSSCGTCSSRTVVQALLLITGKNTSQAKAFLIRVTYSRLRPTYIVSGVAVID
jgi:hypothetical protein